MKKIILLSVSFVILVLAVLLFILYACRNDDPEVSENDLSTEEKDKVSEKTDDEDNQEHLEENKKDKNDDIFEVDGLEFVYDVSPEADSNAISLIEHTLDRGGYTYREIQVVDEDTLKFFIKGKEDDFVNDNWIVDNFHQMGAVSFEDYSGNVFLTGDDIISAEAVYGDSTGSGENSWFILLELTENGREAMAEATERVSKYDDGLNYISIMLDGVIISSPTVNEMIDDSSLVINGDFTEKEAKALAAEINGNYSFTFKSTEMVTKKYSYDEYYDEILNALAEAFDKDVDEISEEDFCKIDAVAFIKEDIAMSSGYVTLGDDVVDYMDYAIFYAGDTEISVMIEQDMFFDFLENLTEIEEFSIAKNSYHVMFGMDDGDNSVFDVSLLSREKFKKLKTIEILYFDVINFDAISDFENLESLIVYGAEDVDFSAVENLTDLEQLVVNSSDISDISAVKKLKKLQTLTIEGGDFSDISAIASLKDLETLVLSSDNITDISPLKNLKYLESLSLSGSEIEDISVIEGLYSLRELSVTNTGVTTLPSFEKLDELESVDLSNNLITDITALSCLDNDNITSLNLVGNKIRDYSAISHIDDGKIEKDAFEVGGETITVTGWGGNFEVNTDDITVTEVQVSKNSHSYVTDF